MANICAVGRHFWRIVEHLRLLPLYIVGAASALIQRVGRTEMVEQRTLEQQERLARVVDGLPAWRLVEVMNDAVGFKRAAELMGWAVLWGLAGETSGSALRQRLEDGGMTYGTAYRAINDFRKVGDALLALDGYQGAGVFESLRHLAAAVAL